MTQTLSYKMNAKMFWKEKQKVWVFANYKTIKLECLNQREKQSSIHLKAENAMEDLPLVL